ncbi:MAG: ATP synthase F1 subunit gamma [Bacilli bacterium]
MASLQNTKRRMKSVDATKKITKAMQLVSSAKLKKAKDFFEENTKVSQFVNNDLASSAYELAKQNMLDYLIVEDTTKPTLYIVVASDMGLCGGYNINVAKEAFLNSKKDDQFILIGTKTQAYFKAKQANITKVFSNVTKEPKFYDMYYITKVALDIFKNNEVGSIKLVYTKFINSVTFIPEVKSLIPLVNPYQDMDIPLDNQDRAGTLMEKLIRDYLNSSIYNSVMESIVCLYASSRMAMENATDNANEIKDNLLLEYNRVRQANITQEIAEIVAGADAL